MEIRHRDIFPWNQLDIHILVVHSDAKVSLFGKKHSKVEESHQENWLTLQRITRLRFKQSSQPFPLLTSYFLCFGTTYMQEDVHTSKSTQAQLGLFTARLSLRSYEKTEAQHRPYSGSFGQCCFVELPWYMEIPSTPCGSRRGKESTHDSHTTVNLLWGL